MRQFPINCPKCQSESWVNIDKLDKQLRCRRCKVQFYLDVSGDFEIGVRPPNLGQPKLFAPVSYQKRRDKGIDLLERIPGPIKFAILGVILAGLGLVIARVAFRPKEPLPATLEGRAEYVALAFAHSDPDRINRLRGEGKPREVNQWLQKSRPPSWEFESEAQIELGVEVITEKSSYGLVIVTIYPPGTSKPELDGENSAPPPPPVTPGGLQDLQPLEVPLFWTLDTEGQWLLDVPKCLKESRSVT